MTINSILTEADYRAMRRYVLFRYRKMHWFFAATLAVCLVIVWFGNKANTPTADKIAGLIGLVVIWLLLVIVFFVLWKILTRFTGGRFRGSVGPHVFEVTDDSVTESNAAGKQEIRLAGIRHVAETTKYFFILTTAGTAYVIPKRDLQSFDALRSLQSKVANSSR